MIEDGGKPVYSGLRVNDPKRPTGCIFGDINCIVSDKYNCDTSGAIYRIECTQCNSVIDTGETDRYIGMTRSTVHSRMLGHLKDQKSKKTSSPMYRHDLDRHNGDPQKYVT